MASAGIEGFFTNHSARRTGGTRLFRAGVQRKAVKEATGHSSDAVDKYQITSDEQRAMMSRVIAGEHKDEVCEVTNPKPVETGQNVESNEATITISQNKNACKCEKSNESRENVGELINSIIEKQKSKGKSRIKISIEIINE